MSRLSASVKRDVRGFCAVYEERDGLLHNKSDNERLNNPGSSNSSSVSYILWTYTGMRVAYGIVVILFLIAAATRLKLKETVRNVEKPNLKEALISYPKALQEGIKVWRNVSSSMFFLFIASVIFRFSFTLTGPFILIYAFYVMQIGGAPDPSLPSNVDPALQLARERWGYVNIVLFISMILLSLPIGRVIDKIGRKKPLIFAGLITLPAIFLFIYGNYLTLFISMILLGAGGF